MRNQYSYMAIFEKEADGGYSIRFPQLPGCVTDGADFEEGVKMAQEALSLHLYGMEKDGDEIPEAKMEGWETGKNEMAVAITAWMTPFRESMENRAVKKTLTIPAWLNAEAEKRKINCSQVLQSALKDVLGIYHP